MTQQQNSYLVSRDDPILITGAAGFIGSRVAQGLIDKGFRNLIFLVRPSSNTADIEASIQNGPRPLQVKIIRGNLLSRQDCEAATKDVALIYHLAAGTGEKSFPDAFMNSVVTTRNLLDAALQKGRLRRFVLVSSFSVYTNRGKFQRGLLDERCPIEEHAEQRGEAYCFGKVKQEEIVRKFGEDNGVPYVIVRPGSVYGGRKGGMVGRIGIDTFGLFLHLGGANTIPFTHVDNCAAAVILAGLIDGVDGEVFNVVDDDLPTSRQFLRLYKTNVKRFKSVYIPHPVSFLLCYLWEKYSNWSRGQLLPAFNRKRWYANWKKTRYSNEKLKTKLGWTPKISTQEGLRRFCQASIQGGIDA